MENGEKMLTYLNRVKQLAAILKSRSVEIDDKEMAMAALNGLPASYESLIVALDALGSDEKCFTFELVKSRLLQEEQRSLKRAATSTNPRTQSALLNIRGGFRQKPPNPYANYRCEKCSNYGHSESRSWGKDVNGKRPPNPSPYRSDKKKNSENALVGAHTNNDGPDVPESDFVCLMSKLNESQFPKGSLSWISDSGCTAHMTFDKSFFHTYESVSNGTVEMGTKDTAQVAGKGTVILQMKCGSTFETRKLENVLHIPDFEYSLLSVSAMDKKGISTTFANGDVSIRKGDTNVATGKLNGSLYVIETKPVRLPKENALVASLQLWHERLGHVDKRGISQMANRKVVDGLKIGGPATESICDDCAKGKASKANIPKIRTSSRASGMLDRVHSDVCGPLEVPSLGGSRYFVTFIDEHSNWVTIYLLKQKSEVAGCFLQFEKYAERQTGRKIKRLRSDRGGEYLSNTLTSYFKHEGIVHELTAAYNPQQNGIAERFNRTSLNMVRSMLLHFSIPKPFWAEALSTAVYIRNRVTSTALPSDMTPHHIWHNRSPSVKHLRVFGCKCWYTLPKAAVQKLDARGRPAIFVGYADTSKAYRVIDAETRKMIVSRDVTFDEKHRGKFEDDPENSKPDTMDIDDMIKIDPPTEEDAISTATPENATEKSAEIDENSETEGFQNPRNPRESPPSQPDDVEPDLNGESSSEERNDTRSQVTRSGRISKPPGSWWSALSIIEEHNALAAISTKEVPKTYKEAISGPDADFWKRGIESEISSLKKYNTWKLIPRSETNGKKVLTSKWVFVEKQKVDANGKMTPFPKGRNVVRGFQQVQGVDYGETFAPVIKYSSVRSLCSTVADQDLEFHQMDATTAFLNGEIDEDIYIEIPEGVEIEQSDVEKLGLKNMNDLRNLDLVAKLEKSMYGTKQAPRCWNKKINSTIADELGFKRSDADPCLYIKHDKVGIMMIALYVDDMLLAAKTMSQINWIKTKLSEQFDMKDLGEAKLCLGLELSRDRKARKLWLTQQSYMEKIVERFGMNNSKPVATPMEEPNKLEQRLEFHSVSDEDAKGVPYREAIGSLMYLMIGSRPDIAYAVGKLARFCENPKMKHWIAVKRVLRYVKGTSKMGLCYNGLNPEKVVGYTDSDWAGDVSDRKSTSAYVFMMAGAAVTWSSTKQTIIATSSCEAEYVAMSATSKEAIWLTRLLKDFPVKNYLEKGMIVRADSQSAMKLAANESINRRNKHIDITYHFVREVTSNGQVTLTYVPTSNMIADMLTKPLGRVKFEKLRSMIGLQIQGEF